MWPRWDARRCLWQSVDQLERAVGLRRRSMLHQGGQADRPYPPARGLRQPRFWRAKARPAVHDREHIALRLPDDDAGRGPGVRIINRPSASERATVRYGWIPVLR